MFPNLENFFSTSVPYPQMIEWSTTDKAVQGILPESDLIIIAREAFKEKQLLEFTYDYETHVWSFPLKEKIYSVDNPFIEFLMKTIYKFGLRILYKQDRDEDSCVVSLKAPSDLDIESGWEEKIF